MRKNVLKSIAAKIHCPTIHRSIFFIQFIVTSILVSYSCNDNQQHVKLPTDFTVIQLGKQQWSLKNLDVITYSNGDTIPEVKNSEAWANLKTGAWCYYNNDPNNLSKYGRLYNGYAIKDSRGLAPKGWHIPTSTDWQALIRFYGGSEVVGRKMRAVMPIENGGRKSNTMFNPAIGGGRYDNGVFLFINETANWWTAAYEQKQTTLRCFTLYDNGSVNAYNEAQLHFGFSVRCLRD